MAVENIKATAISNADAQPRVGTNPTQQDGRLRESIGLCAVDVAASIGSTYRFARVRSNERVSQIILFCTAITSAAADVGLYRTTADGGAVVDVDFFASAVSVATALTGTDVTHEASGTGSQFGNLAKADLPLWQVLGLTSDPSIDYEIAATLTAAATAAGTIGAKVRFVQ